MRHVLLPIVLLLTPSAAFAEAAADFYVTPNGDDSWSGKLEAANDGRTDGPFATIARGLEAAREFRKTNPRRAIIVRLRGGRYELREPVAITPSDSGTKDSPLLVMAYPHETPVLSGGTSATAKVDGEIWTIPVAKDFAPIRHISVGGEMRLASRWPKQGQFTIRGLAGADPKAFYRTPADRFEYSEGEIDPAWKNLNDVEVVVLHFWVDGHYRIKSVDAKAQSVTLDRPSIRRFTEDGGPKPGRFYLSNVSHEIGPGEFHHDRIDGVICYRPMPGETPVTHPVVVPRLGSVVRFDGEPDTGKFVEHVSFVKVAFTDSNFDIGAKVAGDLQAAQHVPGAVKLRGARSCRLLACRFANLGGYGLELADGCRNNTISHCEFARLAAGGIRINGGGAGSAESLRTGENVIADNHIHHIGQVFHAGVGILSQHADRNTIAHNHIHHAFYTGISVGWVWGYAPSVSTGNIIDGNLIHDIGLGVLSDMGGIYMLGVSPGTVVRNNVIHDVESFGYGGWGIYTDEGSTGITIENNLVHHTKSGGFHQHYGKENVIRNNIFALAREGQLMRSRMESHVSFTLERNIVYGTPLFAKNWRDDKFTIDHNLYWDDSNPSPAFPGGTFKEWQTRGHDVHSLVADPLFVDPLKGHFRLNEGSPAEKMGFKPFDPSTAGVRPSGN